MVSRGSKKEKIKINLNAVKEEEIMVIIDETGDRKKGKGWKNTLNNLRLFI